MRTHVDMTQVLNLLRSAQVRAEEIHEMDIPQPERGKNRGTTIAELNKMLMLIAHLCDKSRVLALDEYHLVRGFDDQLVPPHEASNCFVEAAAS